MILVRGRGPCTKSSTSCTRCSRRMVQRPPYVLVGHSYGGALVRLYQFTYAADVAGMVLVDAAADNPWRKTPEKGLVRSSDLATGKPIPRAKTSDPLRYSDDSRTVRDNDRRPGPRASVVTQTIRPATNCPPMRSACAPGAYAQVKMHITNDNPFEADELALLRAERTRREHPLGDLPLVVLSRGRAEDSSAAGRTGEEEHSKDQAALTALSRAGRQVIAKRSGHHIPLDEPDLVVAGIRDVIAAARR